MEPCACNDKKTPIPSKVGARPDANDGQIKIGENGVLERFEITRMDQRVFTPM